MDGWATTAPIAEGRAAFGADETLTRAVLKRVCLSQTVACTLGSIVCFLLVWQVLPSPRGMPFRDATVLVPNAVAFAVFLPLSIVMGTVAGYALARSFRGFLDQGRPATEAERVAILLHPKRTALVTAALWIAAAVLFTAVNARFSGELAFHVGSTVVLGGLTTTALGYLLTDRIMRPLTGLALADDPPPQVCGPGVQGRLVLAWVLATGVPLLGLVLLACHVLVERAPPEQTALSVLVLSGTAGAAGLFATVLVSRSVGEPLTRLRDALGRIEEGDLDTRVRVDDGTQVGLVQSGFNEMVSGLRERERVRDLFGRHVGDEVARHALERPIALGGEQREVAVLFVDVVGSTELASRWRPENVVALLNRFFTIVVETVDRYGGWVNKFEGDAALCVFGAPLPDEGCAGSALAAARELSTRLAHDLPDVAAGIAVSAGKAVAGNVGAERRFEYTVIGDPVNEAARLCELAKRRGRPRLLASEAVIARAGEDEAARWRVDEAVELRGRSEPTRVAVPDVADRHAAERGIAAAAAGR